MLQFLKEKYLLIAAKPTNILGLGDNTSAICCLFKTKGIKKEALYHDAVTFVARNLAELMLSTDHCLASQHIPGKHNAVSDLLSFQESDRKLEFNGTVHPLSPCEISDEELTNLLVFTTHSYS